VDIGAQEALRERAVYLVLRGGKTQAEAGAACERFPRNSFNLGHLGFVLQCVAQLKKLSVVLNAALDDNTKKYQSALQDAFRDMQAGSLFWRLYKRGPQLYYELGCAFIDTCASVALLIRRDNPWIPDRLPSFLIA
jgi:hypothetical protein